MLKQTYLVGYNLVQCMGWLYILALALPHVLDYSSGKLYAECCLALQLFQSAALLEVVHAAVGLVRSNPVITAAQIASRLVLTWPILHFFEESTVCAGFPMLLLAWTITEIIRYAFYTLSLLSLELKVLVFLRYTLFIVLYPIGVSGELWCLATALPRARREESLSLRMPNRLNFTFDFMVFAIIFALLYVPVFPKLYGHMFAQRRKILGKESAKKKE